MRIADIKDGLSNTAAFSERFVGDFDTEHYIPKRDVFHIISNVDTQSIIAADDPHAAFVRVCESLFTALPPHDSTGGMFWLHGGLMDTSSTHMLRPNSAVPDCGMVSGMFGSGVVSARSAHVSLVNVLLMDGSVRPISERIDVNIWHAIGGRQDGDVVSW